MKQQPRIIFFGTPFFALKPFEALIKNFSVVAAVTNPDERAGRSQAITPPPIKVFAEKYRIAILQPRKLPDIADTLRNFHADAFVVAAYGKIIPKEILDLMNEQHRLMGEQHKNIRREMDEMVRLAFEDFGKLSLTFWGEDHDNGEDE